MTIRALLIANRGEIACRIIRACRALGIRAVAVHSAADAGALHTRLADESVLIGPPPPRESYLRGDRIIAAARERGCDALHPGYGFLAENADFAQAVLDAGLIWVGPGPRAMRALGGKIEARATAIAAGVPVLPAVEMANPKGLEDRSGFVEAAAATIGYPLLVKAAAGGGGRGMRLVTAERELAGAIASAQREAAGAFGDGRVFLERCLAAPRHVEIQVLADAHGNCMHLFERECSIQRRHQKIVEESPSPLLAPDVSPGLRARMCEAAVHLARRNGYVNAGTLEFLVEPGADGRGGAFYFLEMNTRLQVEHPVTEAVTGIDLVEAQIRIAQGEPVPPVSLAAPAGHAIECRICAEDPAHDFLPAAGALTRFVPPAGARVETGYTTGDLVGLVYDSLLAKVIVHAPTRPAAIQRMREALRACVVTGVLSNLAVLRDVIDQPAFAAGNTTTDFIARRMGGWQSRAEPEATRTVPHPWQARTGFRMGAAPASSSPARAASPPAARERTASHADPRMEAPMPGVILQVLAAPGNEVARGATLVVMEAMKMELRIMAPRDGRVKAVHCAVGSVVARGQALVELE